jgi:uncharacterized protein (TIGR02246 family)
MKRLVTLCAVAAIALAVTACNQMPDTHDADIAALKANEVQWNQEYVSKDIDKIMAHYAEDAVLIVPGGPPTSGKTAIRAAVTQMVADPALSLKFEASKVDVAKSGDLGYTEGSYTLAMTNPMTKEIINDHGSFVTTYRKQADGSWKAVTDIVTSEVPPPTAPPPAAH